MAKLVHSMIRVFDLERSIAFYREAFGLEVVERVDSDSFALVYMRNEESDFELELTWNRGATEPYNLGSGYGHLGVSVDDAAGKRASLESEGLRPGPLKELEHEGSLLGRYFFVSDPDGYRIEVLDRAGRFA